MDCLQSNFESRRLKTYRLTISYPVLCKAFHHYKSDLAVPTVQSSGSENKFSTEYCHKNHFQEKTCDEFCVKALPRYFRGPVQKSSENYL